MASVSNPQTSSLPREDREIVLDFQQIEKSFRRADQRFQALRRVSFQAERGRVTGLIGPDGAGKTTLMRLAAGLLLPDAGSVKVLGWDTKKDSLAVQSSISYMPQQFGLYQDLTVLENLELYADLHGEPKSARADRFDELMKMTGLKPFLTRRAGNLSGGMKQKLGLACTLVRTPQLLLLDEPTAGVDPVSRRELWDIVNRSVAEEGISVLLSTSNLDEAEHCDEVAILYEGKLLGSGAPRSFSAELRGRTFTVTTPSLRPRVLWDRLAAADGVTDAVLQGERVRLLMDEGRPEGPASLMADVNKLDVEPADPSFEDGFVAILRSQASASKPQLPDRVSRDYRQPPAHSPGRPITSVIEVRDLKRRFGDFYAVAGITFDVQQGEVFGLLGANGAGKSTTFRMLCGLLPPSGGRLQVSGVDVRRTAAAARARIGYVSQTFSLYGTLSVEQNLRFFSGAYGLSGKQRASRIKWAIDQFMLDSWRHERSEDIPLGYKKRLSMACALMHRPDVLFLDEPTSGVDPLARREFWREIHALSTQGVTVMVTTHFMEEAEYCDRLAIMAAGNILMQGTPQEIRNAAPSREGMEPTIENAFIHLIETQPAASPTR